MDEQLKRIARITDLHRELLAKAQLGLVAVPKIVKFQARTGGVDINFNVTTPDTTQTPTGEVIYEKDLVDIAGAPLLNALGIPVLRYGGGFIAIAECNLIEAEGEGFISSVYLINQNSQIVIKYHLPRTPKTDQSSFQEIVEWGN